MKDTLSSKEILKKLEENKEEIKRFGVRKIGLFGSYVRGSRERIVMQIIVEFEEGQATLENFLNLAEYPEKLLGKKVDLITKEGLRSIRIPHIRRKIEESIVYVPQR